MIRSATIEDFPQWFDLAKRLRDQTPYADIEFDRAMIARLYGRCIASRLGCVLVSTHGGRLTGTIVGVAQELWWSRRKYATDLLFFSERAGDGFRLLKSFQDWAWSVPSVEEVTLGQSSGIDVERTEKLYLRAGLKKVGGLFQQMRADYEANRVEPRQSRVG